MSVVAFPAAARGSAPRRLDQPATITWIFSARSARRLGAHLDSIPSGPGAPHDHPKGGQMRLPILAIVIFWGIVLWAVLG